VPDGVRAALLETVLAVLRRVVPPHRPRKQRTCLSLCEQPLRLYRLLFQRPCLRVSQPSFQRRDEDIQPQHQRRY
jgi:hypothetical protein